MKQMRKTREEENTSATQAQAPVAMSEKRNELIDELDRIDEMIDEVLEENATDFLKQFRQEGGE
ncbi:MAG: ubiquitin-like protein Pup [Candidatus Tectomicrobia bacterium]|nr:ubiquitin-like protein Pup [Candidatus Tectomicrobia bacterium]